MNRLGIRTKVQTLSSGKRRGGVPYGKGALAYLLKNRCYVGEIVHNGAAHAADHEPIIDRGTFDAVQASLAANTVVRKAGTSPSEFLLTGLIFDSAGNRMTPSHSRKKGVRYRYYVSQAVLQSRSGQAGQVFRVPAPEIEAVVEDFVRERLPDPRGGIGPLIKAQIDRITVKEGSLEVEVARRGTGESDTTIEPRQVVSLPWSKQPFRAVKGVTTTPPSAAKTNPKASDTILAAIAKARRWVDALLGGTTLAGIAKQEGKGERQVRLLIPLAFVPPNILAEIVDGRLSPTPTDLARSVPIAWNA
jgi:hypothetical protein